MNSLVFFLTLALYQWGKLRAPSHLQDWMQAWFRLVVRWLSAQSLVALMLAVLMPVILAVLMLRIAGLSLFGLPALLLNLIFLWFALGRYGFDSAESGMEPVGSSQCSLSTLETRYHDYIYGWFQSLFLVIFWSLLISPVAGLLIYLLRCWLSQNPTNTGLRLLGWIEWLPARLMVISFAAVGSFHGAVEVWKDSWLDWRYPVDDMLMKSAQAAINRNETEHPGSLSDPYALLMRTLVLWILVVALLVLI